MFSLFLSVLILWANEAPLTNATNPPLIFDVSGFTGADGERGATGFSGVKPGDSGADGQDGKEGGSGGSAGEMELTIGFVEPLSSDINERKVYLRGTIKKTRASKAETVDLIYSLSSLHQLSFLASGGTGGKGGDGGDGGDGMRGKEGSSGSEMGSSDRNGSSGTDGGSGGKGGSGARGGKGGDGGFVKIAIAKGSEILAPLIRIEASAGRGGEGGSGGQGGAAARGGRGGTGACEVFNSGIDATSHFSKCGKNGFNGKTGKMGKGGRTAANGANGFNGHVEFVYADGSSAYRQYSFDILQLETDEEYQDGVFENGEDVIIKAFTLANGGNLSAPAGEYKFKFFDKEERVFKLEELPPGKKIRLELAPVVKNSVDSIKEQVPLSLKYNGLNTRLKLPSGVSTSKPLELVELNLPSMSDLKKEGVIQIKIKNCTKKKYGVLGEVQRKIFVRIADKNKKTVIALKREGADPSQAVMLPVELLEPGEIKTVTVPFVVQSDVSVGWKEVVAAEVLAQTEDNKEKLLDNKEAAIKFNLDPSKEIRYTADLSKMKITCYFPKLFLSRREVKKLSLTKETNKDIAAIQYEVRGGISNPPKYSTHVDDLQVFLAKLFSGAELERADFIDFLNDSIRPLSQSDNDRDWELHKCE